MAKQRHDDLTAGLKDMLRRAEAKEPSKAFMRKLNLLVVENGEEVFRLELGHDEPARVPPMKIEIQNEQLLHWRPRVRKFAPLQRDFIEAHVKMLLELGIVRKSKSQWASPLLLVRALLARLQQGRVATSTAAQTCMGRFFNSGDSSSIPLRHARLVDLPDPVFCPPMVNVYLFIFHALGC